MGNNSFLKRNWKWILGVFISIIAILIPAWQSLPRNKDIDVYIKSTTPLLEQQAGGIKDIVITLDNENIEAPFLSIITITNSGSTPVEKRDFEKPIEINVGETAKIVRARISETIPKGISTELTWENNVLLVHPALLNPNDSVILTILTGSSPPSFEAYGRISGIKEISIRDIKNNKQFTIIKFIFFSISAILCLAIVAIIFIQKSRIVLLNFKSSFLVVLVSLSIVSLSLSEILEIFTSDSFWDFVGFYLVFGSIAIPIAIVINRPFSSRDKVKSMIDIVFPKEKE